jgi:hypothetical protein
LSSRLNQAQSAQQSGQHPSRSRPTSSLSRQSSSSSTRVSSNREVPLAAKASGDSREEGIKSLAPAYVDAGLVHDIGSFSPHDVGHAVGAGLVKKSIHLLVKYLLGTTGKKDLDDPMASFPYPPYFPSLPNVSHHHLSIPSPKPSIGLASLPSSSASLPARHRSTRRP